MLHPDKTKFLLFTRSTAKHTFRIFCNNNNEDQDLVANISEIKRVFNEDDIPAIQFLGVFFDSDLNFKHHIFSLKTKLPRALFALHSVKYTLNQKSLTLLYNSIFHCHLLYAVQIWSCSRSSPINDLFKLQKTAVCIISGSHTEPIFKKTSHLTITGFNLILEIAIYATFLTKLPSNIISGHMGQK